MYLLYVDESGDFDHPDDEHVVLGGVAVHESDARKLAREVEAVFARHLDPHLRGLELHAQHIRKGKGGWRGIPHEVKAALLADIGGLLATFPASAPFALFGIVRSPGAVERVEPLTRVYEELALRFNSYVRKNKVDDAPQMGMFVADEAKYEKIIQPIVHEWRSGDGARYGRLTKIVEVPLFVESHASRLVQLADFVAHAIYLAYESEQTDLFDMIADSFQTRPNGMIDGLMHLTKELASCECLPCTNRRSPTLPGIDGG